MPREREEGDVEGSEMDIDQGVVDVMEDLGENLNGGWEKDPVDRPPTKSEIAAGEMAAESTATPESAPTPEVAPATPTAPPAASSTPTPETWTTEAEKAVWAKLPPEAHAVLAQREERHANLVKQYQGTSEIGVRLGKTIEPFLKHYADAGMDVWQVIKDTMGAHSVLAFGRPEQKVEMFKALAQDIGIDVTQLAAPGGAAATGQTAALQQEVKQLRSQLQNVTGTIQEARTKEMTDQVLAFGDSPEHPHFWDLSDQIMKLMTSGAARNLEEAYTTAVYANPRTRQMEIDKAARERADALAKEAAGRVERATAASAVNLTSRIGGRAMPGKPVSVDDTLAATLAEIESRGN